MIASLLIANRGEIARRIIRTARRMGVRTVAVYSEVDAGAPHVREADEAVAIGPAPAHESYLSVSAILTAARRTGAEAIHPGYGFLSENADFAAEVIADGRIWVGPPPHAIRAMGLKDAAKRLMAAAGVPVTPGYLGEDQSEAALAREAAAIGWPVLIKAVAGGGGKGMRAVHTAHDFAGALAGARREAAAAFGDDRVLLEKLIASPRHIEVQVFADSHGGAVHLFERDCSLQRRHQKVIEEAPAPGMDAETRRALCEAAVRAARAVNYEGAGTVEFIADGSEGLRGDRVWFMEMNTRLQVEHPVTEAVTGIDLVEWQLRIAAGEPLPLRQDQIALTGHAMEARLYAEDPAHGFLPSVGPLIHLRLPDTVRVDAGVAEGGEVTPFYDPMIAKLIAHADTREAAAARLAAAARSVEVWPVKTNAAFLARCAAHPDFIAARIDTGFIEARQDVLTAPPPPVFPPGAVARLARASEAAAGPSPWSPLGPAAGFRLNQSPSRRARIYADGVPVEAPYDFAAPPAGLALADGDIVVFSEGAAMRLSRERPAQAAGAGALLDGAVLTPMPGRIVSVAVAPGQAVTAGQTLVVLEAMKMEHALTAPAEGRVKEVRVAVGDQVTEGTVAARLEPLG
ncbi:MAG TPA: biotin carboxylase N-terminal domain-containing protein [Caulobacteraceae bacterium]|nr:biotin carboxylase N-terminal domain-containing protein [Caulobacteraceae bacterium]